MFRPIILTNAAIALLLAGETSAADVDFDKQIQPIFMENCASCHGEKKGQAGLRLNTPAGIQKKWDKDDHLIVKGKPDESELYQRLVLPADHKKFMPKKGKPLAAEKLLLIHQWIEQGAVFPVSAEAKPQAAAETDAGEKEKPMEEKPKEEPLPEVDAADPAAIEKLIAAGAQVTALYAGSSLLQVSYALRDEPAADADLALLSDVAEQVYSLNLATAQISDAGLAVLPQLKNLSRLHLERSSVADSGLSHLSGLSSLQYLNLYGTQITDAGLKHLEGLKQLQKLYVWQTKVSYDTAQAMEKAQAGLVIDLGFDHPVIMRKRVIKQLEQAKESIKETEAEFKKAEAAFGRAKKDQEKSKKNTEELQKTLDELDGKTKPEEKPAEKDEEKPDDKASEDKAPEDKAPEDKAPDDKAPDDKAPDDKAPDDKATEADDKV